VNSLGFGESQTVLKAFRKILRAPDPGNSTVLKLPELWQKPFWASVMSRCPPCEEYSETPVMRRQSLNPFRFSGHGLRLDVPELIGGKGAGTW